jgi:glycosyltransferase involved in cell wall biosynthesis/hydroxymethylpyrimidine pyrophosphatase-like HAD family hydrolase
MIEGKGNYNKANCDKLTVIHTHFLEPPFYKAGGVRTVWEHFLEEMLKYFRHGEGAGLYPQCEVGLADETAFPYYQGYSVSGWSGNKDDFSEQGWIQQIKESIPNPDTAEIILHHFPIAAEVFKEYKEKLVIWWHANEFFSRRNNSERGFNPRRILSEIKAINLAKVLVTNTETERQQIANDYSEENFFNKLRELYGEGVQVKIPEEYNLLTRQEILDKTIVVPLGIDSDKFSPEYKSNLPSRSQILQEQCPNFYNDNRSFVESLTIVNEEGKKIDNPNIEIFGSWGRIAEQKGLEYTITAFAQVVNSEQYKARNKQGVLMLVGPFDQDSRYFKNLQNLIQELGIQDKVFFPGGIPGPIAQKLFDIGLQTPKYETFGLSLGEMVASIPTFINQESTLKEVYPMLSSAKTPQEMSQIILNFFSLKPEEQKRYISENQNYVRENYNWEISYETLIKKLEEKGFDLRSKELPLPRYSSMKEPSKEIPRVFLLEKRLLDKPLELVFIDFDGTLRNKNNDPEGEFPSYQQESIPAMDNFVQGTKATTAIATARTPLEVVDLIQRSDYATSSKKYNYMGISVAENGSSLVLPNIPKLLDAATELGYKILDIPNQPDFKLISLVSEGEIEKMQNLVEGAIWESGFNRVNVVTSQQALNSEDDQKLLRLWSKHPNIEATQRSIFRCGSMYMKIKKDSTNIKAFLKSIREKAESEGFNCFLDEHGSEEFYTLELSLTLKDKGYGIAKALEIYKQAGAEIHSLAHIGDESNDFGAFEEVLTNPSADIGTAYLVGGPNFDANQAALRSMLGNEGVVPIEGFVPIEDEATQGFRKALQDLSMKLQSKN